MSSSSITARVQDLLATLPSGITLVAAAKTRTTEEVNAAVEGGITDVGHNYVQEAEGMIGAIGRGVRWHLIGHLQKNKAKKAAELFDMIETIDSWKIAQAVDRHCGTLGKIMPVLIEINSGREAQKAGVLPEETDDLLKRLGTLPNIRVEGLMTMGPLTGDSEDARPYFKTTKEVFDRLQKAALPNTNIHLLSMGMSSTYMTAIEEGATIVRIGTGLFA